jgi:4-amino-4-deoxy-L-arabinose transferase-like glycosyltransferase
LDALTNSSSRLLCFLIVIAIFLAVFLGSAFTPALQDDVDTSHAEAAREMLTRGDFVTLHINGVRYLEKAPLMYWLVAFSYQQLGVSDFATRLPTVIAMGLLVLLAMSWGSRAFGPRAGIYAGLFTATGAGCFLFTRVLIPEAILSVLIAAAFYCLISALDQPYAFWSWYAGYALIALAVLAKGLMALVVIGIPVILYLIVTGEWRRWREFRLGSGLLLFLLIAVPWHVLAAIQNPGSAGHHGFLWFYFINEHVLRFLGKRIPKDYNKLPPALYWSLHLVWLFPWSLYLPLALRRLVLNRRTGKPLDFAARTRWICILWATVTLVFFSFSTNQEYYTFPAYLAFFLLFAAGLASEENQANDANRRGYWLMGTTIFSVLVKLAAAAALIAGLWQSRNLPFVPDIGEVLAQTNADNYTLSMGHILDLSSQSFAALRLPAILAVVVLIVGSLFELRLRIKRMHLAATFALGVTMAGFLVAAHVALIRFDPYLSSHVLVERLRPQLKPEDHLVIYGDQAFGSSLVYYLPHQVELLNGRTTSMWFGSTFPDAPRIFLDNDDFMRLWNSPTRVFLFVPDFEQKKANQLLGSNKMTFASSSGKVIYTNHN